MALIKKSTELSIPTTIKMMVYGQSGMGKTTFAISSPKPLLVDFDGGVKRVNLSHLDGVDTIQVASWEDVRQMLQMDLSAYETIVVDTIGKMMDYIISYRCGTRQPQLRDWGAINAEFTWLTRSLSMLNKHIIFVAHRDTRKEGDDTVFIPALREKNYNSVVTELDLLGYMEMRSENGTQRRTVTFDPTNRNDGKNTCNLPSVMVIPNILKDGRPTAPNDFVEKQIISRYEKMLEEKKSAIKAYNDAVDELHEAVEQITDARSANEFCKAIKEYHHVGSSLMKAQEFFRNKVKELNLSYDKEKKTYTDEIAEI